MSQEMNLWKRLQGETPKFFKRVIALSITLAAVGTALLTCENMIAGFKLPEILHLLSQWFIAGGIVGAAVSKTTISGSSGGKSEVVINEVDVLPDSGVDGEWYHISGDRYYYWNGSQWNYIVGGRPNDRP